ncbi:hypothetical protein GGR50DRAFT_657638 [Xylaria sp. CBS 124048]|nr:hypothetical protein GGR50DRAFT_657638 [Xylaria sp. CBS 124048]
MLGLPKAAVLVLSALDLVLAAPVAVAAAVPPSNDIIPSSSFVTLEFDGYSNNTALEQITLDLRIHEATTPCGYGNVTLNGEPLIQNDLGLGSSSIITESGSTLAGDWSVICIRDKKDAPDLLLSFQILSIDDRQVQDAAFSVQFRQTAPVKVFHIEGAKAQVKSSPIAQSPDTPHLALEAELTELENLRKQLQMAEHAVALKIAHISETFQLDQPQNLVEAVNCGSLKCFFGTMYDRMKGMTSRLHRGAQESPARLPGSSYESYTIHGDNHGAQRPLLGINSVGRLVSNSSPQALEHVDSPGKVESPTSTADKAQPTQPLIHHESHQTLHVLKNVVVALIVAINFTIMVLLALCVKHLRQSRKARQHQRPPRPRSSRDGCNALVATKTTDLIRWLRNDLQFEKIEAQENETHELDSEYEEKVSVTMEEDIAGFRAAADVVSNLVHAEDVRGRRHPPEYLSRRRRASTPSSVMSACPTYRSVDESLPAYDEHCSPEYSTDGLTSYTPDRSTARSPMSSIAIHEGSTTTRSSLGEDVEKA